MFDLASNRGWHLVEFYVRTSHLFYEATYQIVAREFDFSLCETVCILLEEFFVGKKKARIREKFVSILFTHLSRYTPYRADIFTSNVTFNVLDLVRYSYLQFVDIEFSFFFVTDGWFCAGPAPVYQHHHHSRPYAHIPSSPYDRLGIRGHRPSPYPNPYHKRTDLPTQGKGYI